jgi:hypothetical protein
MLVIWKCGFWQRSVVALRFSRRFRSRYQARRPPFSLTLAGSLLIG